MSRHGSREEQIAEKEQRVPTKESKQRGRKEGGQDGARSQTRNNNHERVRTKDTLQKRDENLGVGTRIMNMDINMDMDMDMDVGLCFQHLT